MEKEKSKFDWSNVTDDYKKMQRISGAAAAAGILVSVLVVFTSKVSANILSYVELVATITIIFTAFFYLFPAVYGNKKLQHVPNLIYVLAIFFIMVLLGKAGDFFFIFYLLILAIDAFSMSTSFFILSFTEIFITLLLAHILQGHITTHYIEENVLFQFYGIISFSIILRIFATETLSLRKKQDELSKRMRQVLAQKREIYLMIDNITEGLIAIDNTKNITMINKGALKILRIVGSPKKLIGKNIDNVLTVSSQDGKVSIADETLTESKEVSREDLRLVTPERTIRLFSNVAPINEENGRKLGAIILFGDITTKKEVEEQRAEFNAIASHELRTPLTVIEGFLFYLLNDKKLKYDKKTAEYLQKTYDSTENLLHLSNDILTVVKADQKQIKLNLESFDIVKVAREVEDSFKKAAKDKKVILELKKDKDQLIIESDQQKIKEVITNLVENALKFTDKGKIKIEITSTEKDVTVSVTDTGIGIGKDDQKMIFHKFFRSEDWQTRKTGGTGLGLFIVKTYIERVGGKIIVQSAKGKGSRFYFTLPLKKVVKKRKNSEKELNEFIKNI